LPFPFTIIEDEEIMCLIFGAIDVHPKYRTVIAANRDEFYDRPTEPASFWPDAPELLAGRDLRAGGTWIGITTNGRIAALTNYRDPESVKPDAPSRGKLVSDFLLGREYPEGYLERLSRVAQNYNGFSILAGGAGEFYFYSNHGGEISKVHPGVHGLSNHLLDTGWPKVERGKQSLERLLAKNDFAVENIFDMLFDRTIAPDESLPDTGVGLEWERILSPIFITSPAYGTRSSTIILLERDGKATFMERSFNKGIEGSTVKCSFPTEPRL
jgi:uncharacterized protein with NRDE domain